MPLSSHLSKLRSLSRNLFRQGAVYNALDDELRAVLEILVQEKIREGYSASEAPSQSDAERQFGPLSATPHSFRCWRGCCSVWYRRSRARESTFNRH